MRLVSAVRLVLFNDFFVRYVCFDISPGEHWSGPIPQGVRGGGEGRGGEGEEWETV